MNMVEKLFTDFGGTLLGGGVVFWFAKQWFKKADAKLEKMLTRDDLDPKKVITKEDVDPRELVTCGDCDKRVADCLEGKKDRWAAHNKEHDRLGAKLCGVVSSMNELSKGVHKLSKGEF